MEFALKVFAIVQARFGSSRLPGKVMAPIAGKPVIEFLLNRLSRAKCISGIIVATPNAEGESALVKHVRNLGYDVAMGPVDDVLARYYQVASIWQLDLIVRITADCPFIDPDILDEVVEELINAGADYASNTFPTTFPDGMDVEVFSMALLSETHQKAVEKAHREHVTIYMLEDQQCKRVNVEAEADYSHLRLTIDEPEDLQLADKIAKHFAPGDNFGWREICKLLQSKPEFSTINSHIGRNEGSTMSNGQKLWQRAKKAILGGNSLLSKRPDMLLPDQWPTYFSKAKGCTIWDLDDNRIIDFALMGVGTNILGYANEQVNEAVREAIVNGNMSSLNCKEEVLLAERLIEINPWAGKVRFARTGGEANAVAVRIARAASGRDNIAVCGYHGWHDWYLSMNLAGTDQLDAHLLPGLNPLGVPKGIKNSVFGFEYNDFEQLLNLVNDHEIGVIKMEVQRNQPPVAGFLQRVRDLANERGIVLVFDECTSGFRQTFGGIHQLYGIEPDLAVYGKALGNGFAITAVVGRSEVMDCAQSSFISSTFWTERSGPAAALVTLDLMHQERSWDVITARGNIIKDRWHGLSKKYDLGLKISGLPALATFSFPSSDADALQTLFTQEMLKKHFLATGSVYVSMAHNCEIIDAYFDAAEPVFELVGQCLHGRSYSDLLEGPIKNSGFSRLN